MKRVYKIGCGLFGSVDCVEFAPTGEKYALKIISKGYPCFFVMPDKIALFLLGEGKVFKTFSKEIMQKFFRCKK